MWDNIKVEEIGNERIDWIYMAQDEDWRGALFRAAVTIVAASKFR